MIRVMAFMRLFRFKIIYSSWYVNVLRVTVLSIFLWSAIGLVIDLASPASGGFNLVHLIGILAAIFATGRDVYGFASQFHSRFVLTKFKDRTDSALPTFIQKLEGIGQDATGFEVLRFYDRAGFVDFVSYSKKLNLKLSNGLKILSTVTSPHAVRRVIRQTLDESLVLLALKQKANAFRNFTNDQKIAIVEADISKVDGAADDVLHIKISKTGYYASYLRNEFHRDFAFDGVDQSNQVGDGADWSPFDTVTVNGTRKVILADFDCQRNSYHIGVNTLGVTSDGYICLWRQRNGNRSVGRIAPTGSGSMDWDDMKCMKADVFNDAVIYGAERELREESFSKAVSKRLNALSSAGVCLESHIIGLYRWGSLGGLPGFILVTAIPLKYGDITRMGRDAFGGDAECNLDTRNLDLNISPDMLLHGQKCKDVNVWRKLCVNTVTGFRNGHLNELSVPLFACLNVFEETLASSNNLANWLYGFLGHSS